MTLTTITACYNHNEEVKKAIHSLLVQTQPVDQIILVDDGSVVPVENIWGDRVTLIRHPENLGLSAALNTGISAGTSEWYAICSADDEFHPTYNALTSGYDVDIVSVDMVANGNRVQCRAGSLETLKQSNCHTYGARVKKSLWEKVGGYKLGMDPSWEDYEFWVNCAKHNAEWHHVSMPLHIYTRSKGGRDSQAQGQDILLRGLLEGHHQDVFGLGRGVVSIVIPCFAHEQFVREAVLSVLAQTYPHVKVVVVDDGSPGNVEYALRELPGVELVRKSNGGLASARNAGIEFALEKWNSQYFIMLDADDKIKPEFIRRTLASMRRPNEFVYTDATFFGDAWHDLILEDFSCEQAKRMHLHACTFLMSSLILSKVKASRGYYYDEAQTLRTGFEDWEFSLAMLEIGACGKRVPETLFNYRFHENGSMRVRAEKVRDRLISYIKTKHPWILSGGRDMPCASCGGGSVFTKHRNGTVGIAGVGEFRPGEPIEVTYTGSNESTRTKVGAGGRPYRFSGKPNGAPGVQYGRTFVIDARDAPLFTGSFTLRPVGSFIEKSDEIRGPILSTEIIEHAPTHPIFAVAENEFDFTILAGVGPATSARLNAAGIVSIDLLRQKTLEQLTAVLGIERAAVALVRAVQEYGNK